MRHRLFRTFCSILGGAFLLNGAAIAQDTKAGKLKIAVSPKQAYTFIDGKAIGPGDRTIKLDVGTHHLVVANYGFKFAEQEVSIDPGHTLPLDIKLERAGAEVPGPHGRIQIEVGMRRAGDAAILLNGSKPQYFVGHVDEFNNDIIKHQELVVPPGRHELTVTRYGKELWAGVVTVGANQRVIVDISNGKQVTKDWPRGSHELSAGVQRFKAGVVSATIAVAPVSGTVSANPPNIKCNQNTQLAWTSSETVEADMSGLSPVPTSGERPVSPRQTPVDEEFKYTLTATNVCGGSDTKTVTVRLKGSIEPVPAVLLHSVFFPTDYPTKQHPTLGLVRSQQGTLTTLANGFKQYLEYDPDAKLSLSSFADERGPGKYNQSLSDLRAQRVKDFLVSQGIAAEKIDTSAHGKGNQLDKATVIELQARDPNQPPETRVKNFKATWLAYNRRVDILLLPTNAASERFYPHNAADSQILWQRPKPPRSAVESNN